MATDVYRELSQKLTMEHSQSMHRIWAIICNEEEAAIVNSLPATTAELAERHSMPLEAMTAILERLYHRGAVFDYTRDGQTYYRMPRHIVQFHDASLLWPEAPAEMIALWNEFMDTDYRELLKIITEVKLPSFMRVIPVHETIESLSEVLPYENAARMVRGARNLAVTTCVCRKAMQLCDAPLEMCLQLDKGADYSIKRGTGRKIDADEALDILQRAREAGLVHMTENRGGAVNAICNCCSCCCEMLRYVQDEKTRGVIAPSRYQALVDSAVCTGCGVCEEACPAAAIALGADDIARVSHCIGCGLCVMACPVEAITLAETRQQDFIPTR